MNSLFQVRVMTILWLYVQIFQRCTEDKRLYQPETDTKYFISMQRIIVSAKQMTWK